MISLNILRELNIWSMMLRILLAVVVGGAVGMERARKNRPAGFRTYMIVALGACLTMLLSQYLDYMLNHDWADLAAELGVRTDVSRFGAQVVNGVGFLGAGTILVTSRKKVKGLTTAAGLWASACMGLAVGAGFYECVIVGVLLIVCCLRFLPTVERYINAKCMNMNVYMEMEDMTIVGSIIVRLRIKKYHIYEIDIDKKEDGQKGISASLSLRLPPRTKHADVLARLASIEGVNLVEEV